MLKFFIVNFKFQARFDMEGTYSTSSQLLKDIAGYFGHEESFFSVVPRAILVEKQSLEVLQTNIDEMQVGGTEHKTWL
jgi:glycogen debranching enzyme